MLNRIADIRQKITPNANKIIGNASWLIVDKLLRMGAGLFVGVWVARYLGPEQFGLFNYAFAFVSLFAPFASLGLDSIVVREIVQYPTQKNELLGSALVLKLISGVLSLAIVIYSISLFRSDTLSRDLVGILAGTFVFQAFDTVDLWFQSQVKARNVVLARTIAFIISTILKIILIQTKASLLAFAWVSLIEVIISAIGLIIIYQSNQKKLLDWKPSFIYAKRLIKDSYPMIFSGIAIILYMKIDQVMLGQIMGDKSVGVYSAAVRISEVWYFIPGAIASSITPMIVSARQENLDYYHQKLRTTFNSIVLLAYIISISMSFLATPIITSLYGMAYTEAIPILIVHIWASVFVFLGVIRGVWLIAENLTAIYLQTTVLGALVNIILNIILIPKYGGLGAAIATVIAYAVAAYISCFFYSKLKFVTQLMTKAITLDWLTSKILKS